MNAPETLEHSCICSNYFSTPRQTQTQTQMQSQMHTANSAEERRGNSPFAKTVRHTGRTERVRSPYMYMYVGVLLPVLASTSTGTCTSKTYRYRRLLLV